MSTTLKIKVEADCDAEVSRSPSYEMDVPVFVKLEREDEETSVDLGTVVKQETHVEPKHNIIEFEVPQTSARSLRSYCQQCDKHYKSERNLKQHNYLIHKQHGPFECDDCAKQFRSKVYLRAHLRVAHVHREMYYCNHCHKMLKSKYSLTQHMQMIHGAELGLKYKRKPRRQSRIRYSCGICAKWFARRSSLAGHVKTHLRPQPLLCMVCSRAFKDTYNRDRHVRTYHPYFMKQQCKICGKRFYEQSELEAHLKKNHMREAIYECEVCYRKLTSLNNLRRHIDTHIGDNNYVCDYCENTFKNKYFLLMHIKSAHKVEIASNKDKVTLAPMRNSKVYICDICDKVYHRKITIASHIATHNKRPTDETRRTEQTFGTTIKMETNVIKTEPPDDSEARMIDGAEFVTCNCNKSFRSKMEYSMHLYLMHYSELPYVCDVCSKRFLVKGGLLKHYKVLHRLERVPCRLCRLTFMNRSECEAHMETHASVPCSLCSKLYLNKTAMYKHVFYTHKKRECELCGERIGSVAALSSHFCKKGTIEMKFGGTPRQYGRSKALKK